MNKATLFILCSLTLLWGACKKEVYSPNDNPTDYVLTKVDWNANTASQSWGMMFEYNADHMVAAMKRYIFISSTTADTGYTTFQYTGPLCTSSVTTQTGAEPARWYYKYTNSAVGPMSTASRYDSMNGGNTVCTTGTAATSLRAIASGPII